MVPTTLNEVQRDNANKQKKDIDTTMTERETTTMKDTIIKSDEVDLSR